MKTNESRDDILGAVKSLFKEDKADILEKNFDRANRIGSTYFDDSSNKIAKV